MTEKEKQFAGEFYHSGDAELLVEIGKARVLTREYNTLTLHDGERKREILEELFAKIGDEVYVDAPFYCDFGNRIHIGSNVVVGMNCIFVDGHEIHIGSNTMIASGVQVCTATHPVNAQERIIENWSSEMKRNWFHTMAKPVKIGNNVWIGASVTILPGVTIGDNTTIGAGSVVANDIPANVVAIGVPCKVHKHLD
ncbi:sugar O-acetyltransferase [Lentisphaerota bacterium WC36G]|nr:sugar O-acetyltransferase [Lentisphaerae bacterium WC36]